MYNFEIKEARTAITNRTTAGLMIKEHYTSLGSVGPSKIYSRDRYYYEPSDLIQTIHWPRDDFCTEASSELTFEINLYAVNIPAPLVCEVLALDSLVQMLND